MDNSSKYSACGRILFVDKDICMREMMEIMLKDQFHVVSAVSAEEGLILAEADGPFDIVLSSFSLSGMNGLDFLRLIGRKFSRTVRILMTGGIADGYDLIRAVKEGHISRFVLKPYCMNTLLEQLNKDLAFVRGS